MMVTPSYIAAADRPVSLALRASLLMTVIATFFRPAEAVLSVNATREYLPILQRLNAIIILIAVVLIMLLLLFYGLLKLFSSGQ